MARISANALSRSCIFDPNFVLQSIPDRKADASGAATPRGYLHLHQVLEPAIDQPLAVEWRRFRIHHRLEPRIGHHLGVDLVALRAGFISDPGEDHGLARLQLDAAR